MQQFNMHQNNFENEKDPALNNAENCDHESHNNDIHDEFDQLNTFESFGDYEYDSYGTSY